MNKKFITSIASLCILSLFSFVNRSSAQGVVNFADANFKAALVANRAINRNGDGEIQTSEAAAFKGLMNVGGLNINNLQGVEAFTAITGLYCNDNNLSSLNISTNTKLSVLRCDHNQLTALNVSANTALIDLRCHVNSISSLNVSANSKLKVLLCFQNPLQSLSTVSNAQLTQLIVSFTKLSTLDVSTNHKLTYLDVGKTPLKSLNVKNGNNTNFTYFDALQSSALLCIQVDNAAYSQGNWTNVEPRIIFSTDCGPANTDIVTILDANFKAVLVKSRINKNGDSQIQVSEAASYTEEIFAPSKNISDLTGIEAFTALTELHIYDNPITTLDLSKNKALRVLKVENTQITTLDVRANTNLTELYCQNLPLTSLDLTKNTNLVTLWCFANKLTHLDVSTSPKLKYLQCNHNQLTSLTLGNKPLLTDLLCYANKLTTLDVSNAPALATLLSNLNRLTTLDLRANTNLRTVQLLDNKLIFVNIKNGHNHEVRFFNSDVNRELTCIQVDDPAYSENNWRVDPVSKFSTDCNRDPNVVYIRDPNLKAALLAIVDGSTTGTPDGEVQFEEAAQSVSIDISTKNVSDLTGMEAFSGLKKFFCQNNNIEDISHLTENLVLLNCSNNRVTSISEKFQSLQELDLSHNKLTAFPAIFKYIQYLKLDFNDLRSVNLNALENLLEFTCSNNRIMSLTMPSQGELYLFSCNNNWLNYLDVSAFSQLKHLDCSNNFLRKLKIKNGFNTQINYFNAKGNAYLTCIEVDNVAYAEANWRDNVEPNSDFTTDCGAPNTVYFRDPNLKAAMLELVDGHGYDFYVSPDGEVQYSEADGPYYVDISNRNISDLTGLEAFSHIESFICSNNNISHLRLTGHFQRVACSNNQITSITGDATYIEYLNASNNKLTALPVFENLFYINVDNNEFTSLAFPGINTLLELYCSNNKLSSLIPPLNVGLRVLKCNNNKLTALDFSKHYYMPELECENNQLTKLNLKAISNRNPDTFKARGNPQLTCIEVHDPAYAEANWRDNVDPAASFSTDCADPAARIESITVYPNPTTDKVFIKSSQPVNEVQVFDMIHGGLKTTQHGNEIDLSALHKGVYTMKIQQGGSVTSVRIIKE